MNIIELNQNEILAISGGVESSEESVSKYDYSNDFLFEIIVMLKNIS